MIHNIVTAVASRVNIYIKNRLLITEDVVVVGSLVDLKGTVNQGIENKISVFLLSIEEEKTAKNYAATRVINNPIIILNPVLLKFFELNIIMDEKITIKIK